jgi:hypothetical protein
MAGLVPTFSVEKDGNKKKSFSFFYFFWNNSLHAQLEPICKPPTFTQLYIWKTVYSRPVTCTVVRMVSCTFCILCIFWYIRVFWWTVHIGRQIKLSILYWNIHFLNFNIEKENFKILQRMIRKFPATQ